MTDEKKEILTEMYLGKVGELTLKGGNMHMFEKQLVSNVRHALEAVDSHVWLQSGRLYVECSKASVEAVEYMLDHLPGITGWAKGGVVEKNLEAITEAVTLLGRRAKEKGTYRKFALCSFWRCFDKRDDLCWGALLGARQPRSAGAQESSPTRVVLPVRL